MHLLLFRFNLVLRILKLIKLKNITSITKKDLHKCPETSNFKGNPVRSVLFLCETKFCAHLCGLGLNKIGGLGLFP